MNLTVGELISRLQDLPSGWAIRGTSAGSLEAWDRDGHRYAQIFPDGRPTRLLTDRRRKAETRTA